MNKIYKVVFNKSLNTWTAVSELVKGRVKSSSSGVGAQSAELLSNILSPYSLRKILKLTTILCLSLWIMNQTHAITPEECDSSCVMVGTSAELVNELTKGTATTILMTNDISLASDVNVNMVNRQNLVLDGGGYTLNAAYGTSTRKLVFNQQYNDDWSEAGSFTIENLKQIISGTATEQMLVLMDGGNASSGPITTNVNIIIKNIGSISDSLMATMGPKGSNPNPNRNSEIIFGTIKDPISLSVNTNHQLAQASRIKLDGKLAIIPTASSGSNEFSVIFWTNAPANESWIKFTNNADIYIKTPNFTNSYLPANSGDYRYELEDGAKFTLYSNQNIFGNKNNGLIIGSYDQTSELFGSGTVLVLGNQATGAYTTGNAISNIGGGNVGGIGNGRDNFGDVIFNLAEGSKLNMSGAVTNGIYVQKTTAGTGGTYIRSNGHIIAGTGISIQHAGASGEVIIVNDISGVIDAATGINATKTHENNNNKFNIKNQGIINSTTSGITVKANADQIINIDNTGGQINSNSGVGVSVSPNTVLNLTGGEITTTGTATSVNLGTEGSQTHFITGTTFNLKGNRNALAYGDQKINLNHVTFNVDEATAFSRLTNLKFINNLDNTKRNTININGVGVGISDSAFNIIGTDISGLDINVKGAGTGINVTDGGIDLTNTFLNINVNNIDGTGLNINDGLSNITTFGKHSFIHTILGTAIKFNGDLDKTLNNLGVIDGNVTFNGNAKNTINNIGILEGILTTGSGDDTLVLDAASESNGTINLGAGNNHVTIFGGAKIFDIVTGAGNDVFTIENMTSGSTYLDIIDAGTGINTLNINNSKNSLLEEIKILNFSEINLNSSEFTLVSDSNISNGIISIDSNSQLIFSGDFNGVFTATIGHNSASDGSIVIQNKAKVTLDKVNDFSGDWKIQSGGELFTSNSRSLGVNSTFNINGILHLNGLSEFDHTLIGTGVLNITNANNDFDFGRTVGNQFTGTVDLNNTQFTLTNDNVSTFNQATLKLSTGSVTTVGAQDQTIDKLELNGGEIIFNALAPQSQAVGVLNVNHLDLRTGTVNIIGSNSWSNDSVIIGSNISLLDQDRGNILLTLVNSDNLVTGNAQNLDFTVNGGTLTNGIASDIFQNGIKTAKATYDYALSTGDQKGLYVKYGLTELELLTDDAQALLLQTSSTADSNKILNILVTGLGGLQVDASQGTMTIANGNNSYNGSTTVNKGQLILGNNNALGNTSALNTAENTTVNINGKKQTVGTVSNAGNIVLGTGGILTVSNTLTNSNNIDLSNGTLNVEAGGNSISLGGLTGAGTLNVNGGDFTISAVNVDLAGNTNIAQAGTVTLANAQSLGTSTVDVDGILNLQGNGNVANIFTGSGIINTNAEVGLTADNNGFTGTQQINTAGILTVSHANNLGSSDVNISNGGTLALNGFKESLIQSVEGVSGSKVAVENGSVVTLDGDNSAFSGSYNVSGVSTVSVKTANNLGSNASVALASSKDILNLNNFNGTLTNVVTGSGLLALNNQANTTLTSTHQVANSVGVDISSNSQLNINDLSVFDHTLTGSGVLNVSNGNNTFDFGRTVGNNFAGTVDLANAKFTLTNDNTAILNQLTLKLSAGSVTTIGTQDQTIGNLDLNGGLIDFNGSIADSSAKGKLTVNELTLSTGTVNLDIDPAGLVIPPNTGNGNTSILEQDRGQLLLELINAKQSVIGNTNNLVLTINNEFVDQKTTSIVVQDNVNVADAIYSFDLSTNAQKGLYASYGLTELNLLRDDANALLLQTSNDTNANKTLHAKVTGIGGLSIDAAKGALTLLNSNNNYSGKTTVTTGELIIGDNYALGNTSLLDIHANTSINVNGKTQTVGSVNNSGILVLGLGGNLTVNQNFTNTNLVDLSGGILNLNVGGTSTKVDGLAGDGTLNVNDGTLVLSQNNSKFNGTTNISQTGTVSLKTASSLGVAKIVNNGSLQLDAVQGAVSNYISGTGEVTLNDNAQVTLIGNNENYSGSFINTSSSTLKASETKNLGNSRINNLGNLVLNNNSEWDFNNSISGNGQIIKNGQGLLKVKGDKTKASLTSINEGILQLDSLPIATSILINKNTQDILNVNDSSDLAILRSDVLINTNGTLGGYGSIIGNVTNNGNLKMPKALTNGSFGTFTIDGNYIGTGGLLTFRTALAGDSSETDKLVITGNTSGKSLVIVNNWGGSGAHTNEGIKIIDVDGTSDGDFVLSGRVVAGAYEYFLYKGGVSTPSDGDWYLRTKNQERRPEAATYIANNAAANTLFISDLNERRGSTQYLDPITGEIRTTTFWVTNKGSQSHFNDDSNILKTKENRYVFQVGGDLVQGTTNNQNLWRVGIMTGYANSSSKSISGVTGYRSKGSVDGYNIGIYGSWFENIEEKSGGYLDSWLQYGWFKNTVNGENINQENYRSKGLTASIEGGYAFKVLEHLNAHYFIQPKIQNIWMDVKADDYVDSNGIRVTKRKQDNFQTRFGMKAFANMNLDSMDILNLFTPFIEANWIHNSRVFDTQLDTDQVKQNGAKNIFETKIGAHGKINQKLKIWGTINQQLGQNSYKDTSLTIGAKYEF